MDEIEQLKQRVTYLEGIINQVFRGDRYLFQKNLEIKDRDIVLSAVRGTKIGTVGGASGQKIGFFGATPVIRQTANTAPSGGGSGSSDAVDVSARTAIGQIRTTLNNLGLTA